MVDAFSAPPSGNVWSANVSSVLFACTYNAIRSPMAEALMKHYHGHRIYVDSVGVREGDLDPFMVAVMDEIGIDMSRHRCKTFDDLEDTSFACRRKPSTARSN
jgi:protein-tyrosine-phosphatase